MEASKTHKERCFLCGRMYDFGDHRYHGQWVRAWQASICQGCLAANHDGVVPDTYPHLLPHVEAMGADVSLNDRGWLPIPVASKPVPDGLSRGSTRIEIGYHQWPNSPSRHGLHHRLPARSSAGHYRDFKDLPSFQ